MSIDLARQAQDDLGPLLAARSSISMSSRVRQKSGGRSAPGTDAWVRVPGGEVTFHRSRTFATWEAGLLEPYGTALAELEELPERAAEIVARELVPRAISSQLGGEYRETLQSAIRFVAKGAGRTYEGAPIVSNLAVDLDEDCEDGAFASLIDYEVAEWAPVLGSGPTSAVCVDQVGRVISHLDVESSLNGVEYPRAPYAFRHLAAWTSEGRRVAISLTRTREILIHVAGELRYIFRAGRWRTLPLAHLDSLGWAQGSSIAKTAKTEVLASVLDASLGHHGACIAIVGEGHLRDFRAHDLVDGTDEWASSDRGALFGNKSFSELSRVQRLEVLSMDGATVIDRNGTILAAGAIVKVESGSDGGGRLAATRALAAYGAAFKVSQDGPVRLFGRDHAGGVSEHIAFA